MDQNSNMGGFAPMPGQEGAGSNDTIVTPTGFQSAPEAAPAATVGAAPMNNTTANPAAAPAMNMAAPAAAATSAPDASS